MIKNGRQSSDLPASLAVPVVLLAKDESVLKTLKKYQDLISHLAKTSSIEVHLRGVKIISQKA